MNLPKYDIAFIAGSGNLPLEIIENARENKIGLFAIGIDGVSDAKTIENCNATIGIGEIGKAIKFSKESGATKIAVAGYVKRPDFSQVKFDSTGLKLLPRILSSAKKGDDAIMRAVMSEFELNGLELIGPEKILETLIAPCGTLTKLKPTEADLEDIKKATHVLRATGMFDFGQAIVVCDGVILAIEAQEGTDQMLSRIKALPKHLRGESNALRGVLVKASKTIQDKRIDLPTIGINTIRNCHEASLKGVAFQAGSAILSKKDEMIFAANELGMFIHGFSDEDISYE